VGQRVPVLRMRLGLEKITRGIQKVRILRLFKIENAIDLGKE